MEVDVAEPLSSSVRPIDWLPDGSTVYAATIVDVPLPPAEVTLDEAPTARGQLGISAYDHLRTALATAGPNRTPSRHVREGAR